VVADDPAHDETGFVNGARRFWLVVVVVGLGVAAWTAPFALARATYFARVTADEPQYLMTAISIGEDASLDVSDERAEGRYRAFHRADLPVQEARRADGTSVSPHDPLLPALLAVPVLVGGWPAAKLTLSVLAGVLAALLVWTAVRRFDAPLGTAVTAVATFALAAPFVIYGTQVYPELPAALAVTVALAAVTGRLRAGGLAAFTGAVVALPWLSVKYAPVAGVLVVLAAVRLWRNGRQPAVLAGAAVLAVAGGAFLVAHQAWYGGWTPYAAGSHFSAGEATVMGSDPDYLGRSVRLVGLLVDRGFGLAAWQPAYLLAVPALAALARRRPPGWEALAAVLAVGWLNATFVALTMHGWWWPGRQLVVVLPVAVLAVAWWAGGDTTARRWLAGGMLAGVAIAGWLWVELVTGHLRLVVDFETTTMPVVRALRPVLPDLRTDPAGTQVLVAVWITALVALAAWGWRRAARPAAAPLSGPVLSFAPEKRGNPWARPSA
jgi:hypothetical protein